MDKEQDKREALEDAVSKYFGDCIMEDAHIQRFGKPSQKWREVRKENIERIERCLSEINMRENDEIVAAFFIHNEFYTQ